MKRRNTTKRHGHSADPVTQCFGDLFTENESRYEKQARTLLNDKELIVYFEKHFLKFELTETGCKSYISYDKGSTFTYRQWLSITGDNDDWIQSIMNEFAITEAHVVLHI